MILTVTLNPSLDEWVYLPRLRLNALNRATTFARYPGGKGINVSRVAHELRAKTRAVALAGGSDVHLLSKLLTHARIPHRFVTVRGATRNNYEIRTDVPRTLTQINCPGPRVSQDALRRLEQLVCRLRPRPACVVFSGSLPPGVPPAIYARLIRKLHRARIPAVLDASGPALREGVAAAPWLIKPNRDEAQELIGRRLRHQADVVRAATQLAARGPDIVIISLGADGAVLASKRPEIVLWATPPTVRVDSAVGAGDALVAGFVVGYQATRSLQEAFRLGIACGSAAAMTSGTELCHRADVQRLLPRVTIRTLS